MAWTDSDTVKMHLLNVDRPSLAIRDVPVKLDSTGKGQTPHIGITFESEVVKRVATGAPVGPESVALVGTNWIDLAESKLVPGRLVAAADWKLATVYDEDSDYVVDSADGKIRRISGGLIADGATVKVFYQPYEVLERGTDYEFNCATGVISPPTGGSLEADTILYLDYDLDGGAGADLLIPQAIIEAENKILSRLKEGYGTSSTDQGLITGATECALAIVCRGLAAQALADGHPAAEGRAKLWLTLASSYETSAAATLRPFLASPMLNPGGKQANLSWS